MFIDFEHFKNMLLCDNIKCIGFLVMHVCMENLLPNLETPWFMHVSMETLRLIVFLSITAPAACTHCMEGAQLWIYKEDTFIY